ncbi:MAG: SGNH family hydrolase [Rhizobiaceae bacterium]
MRSLFWILAILAVLGLAAPEVPVFGIDNAYSQARKKNKRPSLFQLLFKRKRRKNSSAFQGKKRRRDGQRIVRRRKKANRRIAIIPKVDKLESAARILVIGDFMADGLARGLGQIFAEDANVIFIEKARGLSGIVREDVVNWATEVKTLIDEIKPAGVVVLVGMNDRQQMRSSTGRFDKLTEGWKKEYVKRVAALANATASKNLVWVGLPPVRSSSMNADYLVLNEIFRTQTEAVGGTYVDVWDGYTNAEGKFITAGPDIKGQIVRLRSSDGINMTKAGKRKLGFYAESAIRKANKLAEGTLIASLPSPSGPTQPLKAEYDPAKTGRTTIVSLEGPALDGGRVLEGSLGFFNADGADRSVSFELVSRGNVATSHAGRIDAAWGPAKPDKAQAAEENKAEELKKTLSKKPAKNIGPKASLMDPYIREILISTN